MLGSKLRVQLHCRRFSRKVSLRPTKIHYPVSTRSLEESDIKNTKKGNLKDFQSKSIENIFKMSSRDLDKNNIIILEGKRLIDTALLMGLRVCNLFYSSLDHIKEAPISHLPMEQKILISQTELKKWSSLSTCPGILGIFEKPNVTPINEDPQYPVSVICDNVRDPGNVGSLLRCASAAGCKNIFFTKGCVNVYDRKVLRAAAGCQFNLNLHTRLTWIEIKRAMSEINKIYMADIFENENGNINTSDHSKMQVYTDIKFAKQKMAIIIGGETHGLSLSARNLVKNNDGCGLFIPMKNNVRSLNSAMALGILLFEIRRQFDISK